MCARVSDPRSETEENSSSCELSPEMCGKREDKTARRKRASVRDVCACVREL